MNNIPVNERLIFALDVASPQLAINWLDRLGEHVKFYKVGLQLFMASHFTIIDMIIARGYKVMVDLKFFDIPETVGLAVRALSNRNINFITAHGNEPILTAAIKERGTAKILAVTVLTSFDQTDLVAMGLSGSVDELVYLRAKKALALGCDGIVASGLEIPRLRHEFGERFLIVTPGIRPGLNTTIDDQKRVVTAHQAIANGADYVVVGRPIRDADDPIKVVQTMHNEIATALNNSRCK